MKDIKQRVFRKASQIAPLYQRIIKVFAAIVIMIFFSYVGLAWYVASHKKQVLASVTQTLNENLNGKMTIGDMEPAFLQGFPQLSLQLAEVSITDSLYSKHKQKFLSAGNFEVSVNALALLRGAIEIRKIEISDAQINLFTDPMGYSNSSVFRKSNKKPDGTGGTFPELKKFSLNNVVFVVNNQQKGKLFKFNIKNLDGDIDYTSSGWEAGIKLNTLVRSMAFSTRKGSFIPDRMIDGSIEVSYNEEKDAISVKQSRLKIGGEDFTISAQFRIDKSSAYAIRIENKNILWRKASALLSPNISSRLDKFNLSEPIAVSCDIIGDFDIKGDPLIHVKAKIRDNILQTPGATVEACNFDGEFTNNYAKASGYNDANSAIIVRHFKGKYFEIPVAVENAILLNLEKPVATGDFSSEFEVPKLNNIIDSDLLGFTKGVAKVKLNYRADVENFTIVKPAVEGTVEIKNADVNYLPRHLAFKDVSALLRFTQTDLFISNIHLRSGKSIVNMEGNIRNFLNLYYTAPEKIIVNLDVKSPQLHLGEFMGFLGNRKGTSKKKARKGNFTEAMNLLFDKMNMNMAINVDQVFYRHFNAKTVAANLVVAGNEIQIKNAQIRHAGGLIKVNGKLLQSSGAFNIKTSVSYVDISRFFDAFENFGMQSMQSSNLRGNLSAVAAFSGKISNSGQMVPSSMNGSLSFALDKGELVGFAPMKSIGKLAFPNRNFDDIHISNLQGKMDIAGNQITINPMQVNSSVLNMDVEGVYSFGNATKIFISVPLRNPKRDKDITDTEELAKRRNRGILLRLVAQDGKDGKVKIGLGHNKDEEK